MAELKKPTNIEYMCRVCGTKQTRHITGGRPMPGTCPRSPTKRPHSWVVNRKY